MLFTMPIIWKVKEYLKENNLTAYKLMKASGLTQGTVYRLANNEIGALNNDTLDATIKALRTLTKKEVVLSDLVEYVPES